MLQVIKGSLAKIPLKFADSRKTEKYKQFSRDFGYSLAQRREKPLVKTPNEGEIDQRKSSV